MARKASKPGAFDPAAVQFEDVALPRRTRVIENRKWDVNPFVEPLRSTIGAEHGKAATLPGYHARELCSGLRDAVLKLKDEGQHVGLRLILTWTGDDGEPVRATSASAIPEDERPVRVEYTAKSPRRVLTEDQRDEAKREGFVGNDGKVQGAAYMDWVEAGRPRDVAENTEG